uniref:Uncharacterized protein n=1 Tax=viral metagenome TaxID=1070528 RepID=A0A6C0LNB4_9ZZZZ
MEYANDSVDANKLKAIYDANPSLFNLPANAVDANAQNCSTSSAVNFLYLPTIRGGRKMNGDAFIGGCGCGMKGGSGSSSSGDGSDAYTGGCFTCPKGTKKISIIYGTIHVVIPSLYKKYKNAKKSAKPVAKKAKKART